MPMGMQGMLMHWHSVLYLIGYILVFKDKSDDFIRAFIAKYSSGEESAA